MSFREELQAAASVSRPRKREEPTQVRRVARGTVHQANKNGWTLSQATWLRWWRGPADSVHTNLHIDSALASRVGNGSATDSWRIWRVKAHCRKSAVDAGGSQITLWNNPQLLGHRRGPSKGYHITRLLRSLDPPLARQMCCSIRPRHAKCAVVFKDIRTSMRCSSPT